MMVDRWYEKSKCDNSMLQCTEMALEMFFVISETSDWNGKLGTHFC